MHLLIAFELFPPLGYFNGVFNMSMQVSLQNLSAFFFFDIYSQVGSEIFLASFVVVFFFLS